MYYVYNMILNPTKQKIGEALVKKGYMTEKNVSVVLIRQEFGDSRRFGEIATSLKMLEEKDLVECLSI